MRVQVRPLNILISIPPILSQVLLSTLLSLTRAEADPYYANIGAYGGAALGYPYAYSQGGYAAPHSYAAPAAYGYAPAQVHTIAAPVIAKAAHLTAAPVIAEAAYLTAAPVITEVHSELQAKVPSVTSSQFHSQDEEGNYAFGYNNINSFRVESGNALTGVSGSYSDGFRTYNYVADDWGFRHV